MLKKTRASRNKAGTLVLMLQLQDFRCFYCGKKLRPLETTRDHFNPRSLGGKITLGNYVASCHNCNQKKGDRLPTKEEKKKLSKLFRRLAERILYED